MGASAEHRPALGRTVLDLGRLPLAAALPSAIGVGVPLIAGLAAGQVQDGVSAAVGALIVGFANLGGTSRVRLATPLAAAVVSGLGALLGGVAGPDVVASVVLMGAWGFAGALLGALGPRPAFVGMLSTWALLRAADLDLHGAAVAREAALITAGGLVQVTVAIVAWRLRPLEGERRAVADAYRALADYARAPAQRTLLSSAGALARAADTVGLGTTQGDGRGRQRARVEQGEWIRVQITALARSPTADTRPALVACAQALDAIAAGTRPTPLDSFVAAIRDPAARRMAEALGERVDAAADGRAPASAAVARASVVGQIHGALRRDSVVLHHATRLSVALMVAVVAYRGLGLGWGYWVPLTVLFVLRPDFGETHTRNLGRAAGTIAGVLLASLLASAVASSDAAVIALVMALMVFGYALYPAHYATFSVLLTIVVALLVELGGGSLVGALDDRLIDTAVGSAIALTAFTFWPTREAPQLDARCAELIDAQRRWLDAVLRACSDGETSGLRSHRLAVRRARGAAEEALRRALAEPPRRRPDDERPRRVLSTVDELSQSTLALVAVVDTGARVPRAALDRFRVALGRRLEAHARAVQTGTQAGGEPLDAAPLAGAEAVLAAETARISVAVERLSEGS